jgi:hypothetical protein
MIENLRKNNIEFRTAHNFITEEPYYEIVKWENNPWYENYDDFELTELGRYHHKHLNYYISESLFHRKETCYTLATFYNREDEIEPDLKTVSDRPFRLSDEDTKDFMEVARYGFDKIIEENRKKYD